MRVFVIGATGFIGGTVARQLIADENEVVGLYRSDEAASELEDQGITPVRGDLTAPDSIISSVGSSDATMWIAPRTAEGTISPAKVIDALRSPDNAFILTTGTGAYTDTGGAVVDESVALSTDHRGAAQSEVESSVLQARRGRTAVIRPVWVYGDDITRRGWMRTLIQRALELGVSYYPEDGAARRVSTVHVEDLANLYSIALEEAKPGTLVNAPAEPPVSVLELAGAVATAAGIPRKVEPISADRFIELFGALGIYQKNMVISPKSASDFGWEPGRKSVLEVLSEG